jgi:3-deoxy-D-manno-octulosonic-acid transferase
VVQLALSPAVVLYLLYRGLRDRRYFAGLKQRLGWVPLNVTDAAAIWFHAVSVGEVLAAAELIRRLRIHQPRIPIFLSTSTLAGRALADQKFGAGVFFAPLDYRSIVRRVLRRIRPSLVVVLETEIWPNLYRESKRAGASLVIVNGRISDRAFPSYRRWRFFFRHVLLWPDAILVQSSEDARRFELSGAPEPRESSSGLTPIRIAGNLKYDFTPPSVLAPEIADFLNRTNPSQIWIAASTMSGDIDEDDAVLDAFPARPGLLLILAPRKPERFDAVAEKLRQRKIPFVRRTAGFGKLELPGVLLLDSIGELAAVFERADVVFMGGTLANRGGHNILEPAYFAKPIVIGPHMENFAAIAEEFRDAVVRIPSSAALGPAIMSLLDDAPRRAALGSAAREIALSKRGVSERVLQEILRAYALGVPHPPRTLAARIVLTPLSWIWRAGTRLKKNAPQSLSVPVISIGGLSMGGAGKSPLVAHLAARLRHRNPAILTRGYKRESSEIVIVPRGGKVEVNLTGDEAQIFIRAADAHVGIGANRFAVGEKMQRDLAPGIFILDDGFQHRHLARTHDIVVLDAFDPTSGGVFPLGRLREPLAALARADIIVLSHVRPGQPLDGIEKLLARYNPRAPVFRSRVTPRNWVDFASGEAANLAGPVFAFCGLGTPRSFWATLDELGIQVSARRAFPDHHRYDAADLQRIAAGAAGAAALVTTEKDAMNLPANAASALAPLKLYWLKIGIEIEREEELLQRLV